MLHKCYRRFLILVKVYFWASLNICFHTHWPSLSVEILYVLGAFMVTHILKDMTD